MKQKNIFLDSEGNEWFKRNLESLNGKDFLKDDPLIKEILSLAPYKDGIKVLEIGCGDGSRLKWLNDNLHFQCYGLDPSDQAITVAKNRGVYAQKGTADQLPFESNFFDIVIFGFCLYLCDREDLFKIASEADRVLCSPGWMFILDFFSPNPLKREYHHRCGIYSYKMDYRTLFTWHPSYLCISHKITSHEESECYIDDPNEWIATSVIRKNQDIYG
jgi:ubiquinone/menaquinone biosynthesis C-methylase UbiE